LSDEERVLRLLERKRRPDEAGNHRLRDRLVERQGVAVALEDGRRRRRIEKLRIGRENLITLPGVDPTETN